MSFPESHVRGGRGKGGGCRGERKESLTDKHELTGSKTVPYESKLNLGRKAG